MGSGIDSSGGSNEQTAEYKNNPSLENYLRLRRENPEAEIEVAIVGGLDPLIFMVDELRRHGLDPELVAGVMDADENAISDLSLQLIEKITNAKELERSGETHLGRRGLVIPDKLVNWLICVMLEAQSWNGTLRLSRDLIVLIRERLRGSSFDYERAMSADNRRTKAVLMAGQLKAQGKTTTRRMIAEHFGVAPSTVTRWFEDADFESEVDRVSQFFDSKGELHFPKAPRS